MTVGRGALLAFCCLGLVACGTTSTRQGTLAELRDVNPDVEEIYLEDSLERAAQSYRRYLQETQTSARTPEAMRRLADLQIEQAYGVIGSGELVELAAPQAGARLPVTGGGTKGPAGLGAAQESEEEFERRATAREVLIADTTGFQAQLPGEPMDGVPAGPREAIATYQQILRDYPNYERNDKVLYQMSRAYDEIGQPDEAMAVMDRLIAEYPFSKHVDEIHFRRGEYFFIRKKYLDAEEAYAPIIAMGAKSSYYELALYKQGWALYKQEMYEEALNQYMAMLDYRLSIGYDFQADYQADDEHRIADTFRVISLSFSNLGGPEVVDEYFHGTGHRSYADKIYGNLGEFYFAKLRYEDAASVYRSFIELNPFHQVSPHFSMRIVEIYGEAGFPQLVVESKKEFARRYALDNEYWNYFDVNESAEVVGFLKTNLTDLAGHYHALYQDELLLEERPANFSEADLWYRQFLRSFPAEPESPSVNYRLADLLLENADFGTAALEYERTAYEYEPHEQAAAAGYAAVFAHRQHLEGAGEDYQAEVRAATVASSLRFAEAFQAHEQAPFVLGAAADDLYEMQDFEGAIDAAAKVIERYPATDTQLLRSVWTVIGHAAIDLARYPEAEVAYSSVLALTPEDDEGRPALIDGLAAAIYKQGEQANLAEDYRAAAGHFLRIKDVAPTSGIRTAAEYDAAAALIKLEDWSAASGVLEEFRVSNPEHDLGSEATKQLAFIYREDGQLERSAAEHERIAAESADPELGRAALLTAAELYDEVGVLDDAVRVYEQYVAEYPQPLDLAMESRTRLAEIFKDRGELTRHQDQLRAIVAADAEAGPERTDRSRYLASKAALSLAEDQYEQFAVLKLVQPFETSLAEKQRRMDIAMAAFEALVGYEVAVVTAAATYYMAEIYLGFSQALMDSERPAGLSAAEKVDYEMVIEEEAYPFEERSIGVHEANFEMLVGGIYNEWVQKSLDKLVMLVPGKYAKNEISGGFLGSIDSYAYRMPGLPELDLEAESEGEKPGLSEAAAGLQGTAQVTDARAAEPVQP